MFNIKKWMATVANVPTLTTTINGGTLESAKLVAGMSGLYIAQIRVTITSEVQAGANLFTANVKLDGVNTNGFGVSFNGRNPVIALLNGGTLTVRNASSNIFTSGTTHTIAVVLGKALPAQEGGVISYFIHLTESLKSFVGRRWASYAEPHETADEAVRTGELSYSGCYGNIGDIDKRKCYSVGDRPETAIRNAHRYSWILHRWNSWEQQNKRLCHENARERGSACCQEQCVKRGIHQTALVLSCSGLAPAPERGWWCA